MQCALRRSNLHSLPSRWPARLSEPPYSCNTGQQRGGQANMSCSGTYSKTKTTIEASIIDFVVVSIPILWQSVYQRLVVFSGAKNASGSPIVREWVSQSVIVSDFEDSIASTELCELVQSQLFNQKVHTLNSSSISLRLILLAVLLMRNSRERPKTSILSTFPLCFRLYDFFTTCVLLTACRVNWELNGAINSREYES